MKIIGTAWGCIVYDSCAQQQAHKCEQLLNLCVTFRIGFVGAFCKGSACILCVICVSLGHSVFALLELVVLDFVSSVPS